MDWGLLGVAGSGMATFASAVAYGQRTKSTLEGRLNGHDLLFEEREKLADERHQDVKAWLMRIDRKLDHNREDQA